MSDAPDNSSLGQDDIDAALAAGGSAKPAEAAAAPPNDSADDLGLSQADIDAALGGLGDAADVAAHAAEVLSDAGSDDVGLSQADIDAALAGAGTEVADVDTDEADDRVDATGRPFDSAAAAMAAAIEEEGGARSASPVPPPPPPPGSAPLPLPDLTGEKNMGADSRSIDLLRDVDLQVKIELGRSRMLVGDVLRLGQGAVVELDKLAGDPVDVLVNERLVARGEVLVLNDNFCVRINEIISLVEGA